MGSSNKGFGETFCADKLVEIKSKHKMDRLLIGIVIILMKLKLQDLTIRMAKALQTTIVFLFIVRSRFLSIQAWNYHIHFLLPINLFQLAGKVSKRHRHISTRIIGIAFNKYMAFVFCFSQSPQIRFEIISLDAGQ